MKEPTDRLKSSMVFCMAAVESFSARSMVPAAELRPTVMRLMSSESSLTWSVVSRGAVRWSSHSSISFSSPARRVSGLKMERSRVRMMEQATPTREV